MKIKQVLHRKLQQLKKHLEGKTVGIDPGEFGRFNQQMKPLLSGVAVEGIYTAKGVCDQGYDCYDDKAELLRRTDIMLDFDLESVNSSRRSPPLQDTIQVLGDDDPLGLIVGERPYTFHELFLPNDEEHTAPHPWSRLAEDVQSPHEVQNAAAACFGFSLDIPPPQTARGKRFYSDNLFPYQKAFVETGYLFARCPFCGAYLRSDLSYTIFEPWGGFWLPSFVEFNCQEGAFYLLLGGSPVQILGFYFPGSETIVSCASKNSITIDHDPHYLGFPEYAKWINEFKRYCVLNWHRLPGDSDHPEKRKPAVAVGWIDNIGHTLHDELSALEYLLDHYHHGQLPSLIPGNRDKYDVQAIYPEFRVEQRFRSNSPRRACMDLLKYTLENNLFCLRISHIARVQASVCKRVFLHAKSCCPDRFFDRVDESRMGLPVIWITLRSHHRVWIDMVENLVRFIDSVRKDFPSASFILDGLPAERERFLEIKSRLAPDTRIFDGTQCSFHESIFWIHFVDYTVQGLGTGTVLSVIANKTGIVYSVKGLLGQQALYHQRVDMLGNHLGRENGLRIATLLGESDGAGEHINYDNVIMKWEMLYDCARDFNTALQNALCAHPRINFQGEQRKEEWVNVDLRSSRFAEPVSSDFEDGRYCAQLPMAGRVMDRGAARFPWPDNFAAQIDGGLIAINLGPLKHCIGEWYRMMTPGGKLSLTLVSLDHAVAAVKTAKDDLERERLYCEFFENGDGGPLYAEMVVSLLRRAGFTQIRYRESENSADGRLRIEAQKLSAGG